MPSPMYIFSGLGLRSWFWVIAVALAAIAGGVGCGGDDVAPLPNPDAGNDAAPPTQCVIHADCDDGAFCNGAETCDASHPNADPITHCVSGTPIVCNDDVQCTDDSCDEVNNVCVFEAPDADNDGHRDAACLGANSDPLGTDCDDNDANRFPGNTETCDPTSTDATHDEDCDATTFGTRDVDQDTHVDDRCCNTADNGNLLCGDDCNDNENSAFTGAQEICDAIDNDCDPLRALDNGLFCGACMCSVPNATPSCTAGATQCTVGVCDTGYLNCDMDSANGCEALRNADTSCGQCGNVCTDNASCAASGGSFACACDDGFMGDGVTCTNIDECAVDNGGCDALVTCTDNEGGRVCGACPTGYIGDGEVGCDPVLMGLTASFGTLSPTLGTTVRDYELYVPVTASTVSLTPSVATGASVAIDDVAVTSGAAWVTPALALGETVIEVDVAEAGRATRSYTITITRGGAIDYLKASNTGYYDLFGQSVAIDGDTLVVGASDESSAADGVNGDQTDDTADYAGAAYVFVWNGQAWQQQAYLKASNSQGDDYFGWAVAIDGDTIAVSADEERSGDPLNQADNSAVAAGAVYVFTRSGSTWTQQAYLKAAHPGSGDYFGEALALEGDTLVIGAIGEDSNARGVDGDQTNNAASQSGAVYVFERTGTAWAQAAFIKASNADAYDYFGRSVALAGDTIVAGAAGESSSANTINGNQNDNSRSEAGAAYVFVRSGNSWAQQAYLKPTNAAALQSFGYSVTVDGDTVAVGAYEEDSSTRGVGTTPNDLGFDNGAAYVFERSGSTWSQTAYLKASNSDEADYFGQSVVLEGDTLVVGAVGEEGGQGGISAAPANNTAPYSGALYVFARSNGGWSEVAYLKALSPDAGDQLGYCVALSDGVIVAGARREDGNGTGATGNPANNDEEDSGAAYVFR